MNARANVQTSVWERTLPWALPALLVVGFLLRALFLGDEGFKNDVQTFEAWTMSLVDNGLANFYAKTRFADYPPGYFYVLAVVGHIWQFFRPQDTNLGLLKVLVKLPAVLADLGVGWIIYRIGCRFARPAIAFGAAALYVLNPATIFISAKWGQVDSIAGGLALLAAYLLLRSDDDAEGKATWSIVAAWLVFSYSLLIKPQAAVLIPHIYHVRVRRSGAARFARARDGNRYRLGDRAWIAAGRSVPSHNESHCARPLAFATLRIRLECLLVQQRQCVQSLVIEHVVDRRCFLEGG